MEAREKRAALLDEEFMPLHLAAGIAYSRIMGALQQRADDVQLVGIALSTVAPIYRATHDGAGATRLGAREIEDRLFRPLRSRGVPPMLGDLRIRRGDLDAASAALKEARAAFG